MYVPCPRQGDVGASPVGEEADGARGVGPDGGEDDDVLLAALEPIHGVDAKNKWPHRLHVAYPAPNRLHLRGVRAYDAHADHLPRADTSCIYGKPHGMSWEHANVQRKTQ